MKWTFVLLLVAAAPVQAQQMIDNDHRAIEHADFWINHGSYKSPADGSHCCGKNDCFVVPNMDVLATPMGWLIKSLGETIPYPETQTSEDGEFWRCKRYDGSRRCFFAPPPGS